MLIEFHVVISLDHCYTELFTAHFEYMIYNTHLYAVILFFFLYVHDCFMYVLPDDDPVWIETCCSLILV